jgi:hypothetical protein
MAGVGTIRFVKWVWTGYARRSEYREQIAIGGLANAISR